MSIKHTDQRIGVFVDVQNLYYSARHIYNAKVNFRAILQRAIADRKLIRAVAYVIRTETGEEQAFFDALSNSGFEIKEKDLKIFYGGNKKGDWDVGITVDMIRSKNLDVIILVSGDGDFRPAVEYLKNNGQLVEAIAFGKSTSIDLKESVDEFIDLDQDHEQYLINRSRSPRSSSSSSSAKPRRSQAMRTRSQGTAAAKRGPRNLRPLS
jgi:uncharacterized LabA/DUF88 family protein